MHASSVKASNLTLTDFHRAINECEHSLCAAVVPYFLSRAVSVNTRNAEQYDDKLWILENLSGVFEVNKILLNSWYTALSCEENVAPEIWIFKVTRFVVLIMLPICILEILQGLAPFISAWILQNLYKLWKNAKLSRYTGTLTCIIYYIRVHCSSCKDFLPMS